MDPAGRAVHPPGCDTRTRIPEPSRRCRRIGRILGTPPDADQGDSVVTARVASVVAPLAWFSEGFDTLVLRDATHCSISSGDMGPKCPLRVKSAVFGFDRLGPVFTDKAT